MLSISRTRASIAPWSGDREARADHAATRREAAVRISSGRIRRVAYVSHPRRPAVGGARETAGGRDEPWPFGIQDQFLRSTEQNGGRPAREPLASALAFSSIASKVSGSTPRAMCRSRKSWRLKSKSEPSTSKKARQEPSEKVRFAADSPLEGDAFEPSVPAEFFWLPGRYPQFTSAI